MNESNNTPLPERGAPSTSNANTISVVRKSCFFIDNGNCGDDCT
jgi:hypothetical protein